MRLRATDQVCISAVKSDNLRPGEEFEVPDEQGEELLKKLPRTLVRIHGPAPKAQEKALSSAPENKARRGKAKA